MEIPSESGALLSLLRSLPPSPELLELYHEKLSRFLSEEEKYLEKLSGTRFYSQELLKLTRLNAVEKAETGKFRRRLGEMEAALHQERKLVQKLYRENDSLRIQELENRRKVGVLMRMNGKSDAEIVRVVDHPGNNYSLDLHIPQRLVALNDDDKIREEEKENSRIPPLKKTRETLCLENKSLESQLIQQEKCHVEQISTLDGERRLLNREKDALIEQYEARIRELSLHVNALEEGKSDVYKDLSAAKKELRAAETKWDAEREKLYRKIQFYERYDDSAPFRKGQESVGGYFTHDRALERNSCNVQSSRQIQKLNSEVCDQKNIIDQLRSRLVSNEAELDSLRESNAAMKESLRKRSKSMSENVDALKQRYENLENRRKNEASGYQADVKLLTEKLRDLERQLIAASLAKSKEHGYIKTIRHLKDQNEQLTKDLKQKPGWIN